MAKVFYLILFTLIGLLMVAVLGVTIYTFLTVSSTDKSYFELLKKMDFSLILSSLTLLLGGSIILPTSIYEMIKNKDLIDHEIACSIKKSSKGTFFDIE